MNRKSIIRCMFQLVSSKVHFVVAALLLVAAMSANAGAEATLHLALGRDQAYSGETVPVSITLRIGGETVRNIGFPRLSVPGGEIVAFPEPVMDTDSNDPSISLYRFAGQIRGVKPGAVSVGPAILDCEIMATAGGSAAFFGAAETHQRSLVSNLTSLTVLPLPLAGRPPSFSGAVGIFNMNVNTIPKLNTVGEPLTIITTIRGDGSLANANCPDVKGPGLSTYQTRANHAPGALVCEQVVVPEAAGSLPPLAWSYFDPFQSKYLTLRQALPEAVIAPHQDVAATPVSSSVSQSTVSPPSLHGFSISAWILTAIVTSCAFVVGRRIWLQHHHSQRDVVMLENSLIEQKLAFSEQVLAAGDVDKFYTTIFEILQLTTGSLHKTPATGISGIPILSSPLSPREKHLYTLFSHCDAVRYGHRDASRNDMNDDLSLLYSLLEDLNIVNLKQPASPR